ncbi:MAG: hypothetical protein JRN21_09620 [Nitrososphaerota archaeon]|nr:hypothetical protein [Nitrososphaerota archaeon]
MVFMGTAKLRHVVYTKNIGNNRIKEIDAALELQQNILSFASGAQVISEALFLANKTKDRPAKAKLTEIASHVPSDSELSEALNIQLSLQTKVGKDAPDPSYIMLPTVLRQCLFNLLSSLLSSATHLNVLTQADKAKLNEYRTALESDFFLDDLKDLGSNGGIVNHIHKALVALKKKELVGALEKPSKRIVVEAQLLEDSRVAGFIKQWQTMGAEKILDQTTGVTTSGVLITSGKKKGQLEFQIQVGQASNHSIVIEDDASNISLLYNDHDDGRISLLKEILQRVGFTVSKYSGSLTAVGPSKPATYVTLAKIIPNMVDLDYVNGFQTVSASVKETAIQGILAGYPVTLRRTTGTANIKTYEAAYQQLTGKKAKKTKATAYSPAQEQTEETLGHGGFYPPGTIVWITGGEGYAEETPLNPQETLYYDNDYLYVKSLTTGTQYTKTPSKVTHLVPSGAIVPNGVSKFKLSDGSTAYTRSPKKKVNAKSTVVKVAPKSAPPAGAIKSIDDLQEGDKYIILGGGNAGTVVTLVKKLNDNAVLVQLPDGKKTGKYYFNLGYK